MTEPFSLSEAFRLAEEIERNGYKFYTQAAAATENPKAKELMGELARQEKNHQSLFAGLREQFCTQEDNHWVDPDGQAAAYINSMAEVHVFNLNSDVTALLASVQSPQSTLRLAINFEKDTIAFFSALREGVPHQQRDKVDLLIQEELKHVRVLQDALVSLG